MIEIKYIAVSKLLKTEAQLLLNDVIVILKKHNPELLRLHNAYDMLVSQAAKIDFFTKPYGKHALTYQLDLLRKERLKCASFIAMQVRSFENSNFEAPKKLATVAKKLSKPFLINLGRKNLPEVESQISLFFINLENSPEEKDAFAALGLQPYINELERLNNEHTHLYSKRARDIENRPPTSDRSLEVETQKKLRLFFEQVNSFQNTFTDIDYTPFIYELNLTLAEYSRSIKTRIATNKRRARKKAKAVKKNNNKSKTENKTATQLKPQTKSSTSTTTTTTQKDKKESTNKTTTQSETKNEPIDKEDLKNT